jgi:ribosomal protein S27AE
MKFTTLTEEEVPVVSVTVLCPKCKQSVKIVKENNRCSCGAMIKYLKVNRNMDNA